MTGPMGDPLNASLATSGQPWQNWDPLLRRSPTGTYRMTSPGTTWSSSVVAVEGPNGEAEATVHYPLRSGTDSAVAGLVFRSGQQKYLGFYARCGGTNNNSGFFGKTYNQLPIYFGPAAAGVGACGTTHTLKVTFSGVEYRGYINGNLVASFTDSAGAPKAPLENFGVGVTLFENTSDGSLVDGLVIADFTVNGGCATDPVACGDLTQAPLPHYACGRTLRDVGGGTFFVDLEAGNASYGGEQTSYTDERMWWTTSWGVEADTPEAWASTTQLTMALPPLSEMPPGGWWARFSVYREMSTATIWGEGYWDEIPGEVIYAEAVGGPAIPMWAAIFGLANRPADEQGFLEGVLFGDAGDLVPTGQLPAQTVWQPGAAIGEASVGIVGTCTVRIDPTRPTEPFTESTTGPPPPADPQAPPTTTTTTTSAPPPAERPTSGFGDQGEDGTRTDCSGGYLGRLPIIGGAFELVARLACAIKQLLVELFVPDDWGSLVSVGEFGTKFPGSWVSEGTQSVEALKASVQAGAAGSACAPAINVPDPVGMTVRFPSPAGCGGTGSTVTAGASEAYEMYGFRGPIRAVLTFVLYATVLWRLIRLAPWAENKDDGAPVPS